MRRELVETTSWRTAKRRCPWAVTFCQVSGGILAFESRDDARTWLAQR